MADLVLGLAKTTVEGTVTMARSAMEEEVKLQKTVQRALLVITDEFEMMHSFLKDAKDSVTDHVTKTLVRQVRNTALDVEDCIEIIVHLDKKPHWLRPMMFPWCMPAAAPWEDLDAAVANLEQLKARVEAMGHRNLRYNRIGDPGRKPVEQMHQHAAANAMVPSILLVTAADAAKKQSSRMDLVTLINKKEKKEEKEAEKEEVTGNVLEEDQKVDVHQLKVISLLGTGSDVEIMTMKKAYDDSETCKNFTFRAWVKLVHPFNPIEFIRSLLPQFYRNYSCSKQKETANFLEVLVATDKELILDFMNRKISQRYLVVLEDVSTMADWEVVRSYLPDNINGSCVVVHTRQHGIACSCVGHQCRASELEKLSADHSVYVLHKEVRNRSTLES